MVQSLVKGCLEGVSKYGTVQLRVLVHVRVSLGVLILADL